MSKKLKNVKCQTVNEITNMPTTTTTASLSSPSPSSKIQLNNNEKETKPQTTTMIRSNSCIETKYKFTITPDRLLYLRKTVEQALRDHKVFMIKGGWPIIRNELLKRNWIEKYEQTNQNNNNRTLTSSNEDLLNNLPIKQDWESPNAYDQKCERTIMSRMLRNTDVDFYWHNRKDQTDIVHRSNPEKIMNRYAKSLFASKEGLALLLQQSYWYTEPGVSSVNFPRCYVLGFPDHFNMFVDDFRLTACTSLLKWLINAYETTQDCTLIESEDGDVPISALQFALERCKEHLDYKKHLDIDKNYERIWDHEWDQFLSHYYRICHGNGKFLQHSIDNNNNHNNNNNKPSTIVLIYKKSRNLLVELQKLCPEINGDGTKNIWILKPGNKCRGKGIQLIKSLDAVEKVMNLKLKYVVQKYIERPLLIYQTKFDIRQWFIVTNTQPLVIWMYRDSYLRFSSQIFNLENFHESLHLTNHSIQCKYTNEQERNSLLPQDNMWDSHTFQIYLNQLGYPNKWKDIIYPGMRQSIICAMLSSQDVMDKRPNTFELYGADFMITEDFKPWLIEINCSPDLSWSTSVTKRMCPKCLEDLIKVIVDKRFDSHADTGLFDCIYRQNFPRMPLFSSTDIRIKGRKMFRTKIKIRTSENKQTDNQQQQQQEIQSKSANPKKDVTKIDGKKPTTTTKLPDIKPAVCYKGPVIEDLIENIQKLPTTIKQLNNTKKDKAQSAPPVVTKSERKKKIKRKQNS